MWGIIEALWTFVNFCELLWTFVNLPDFGEFTELIDKTHKLNFCQKLNFQGLSTSPRNYAWTTQQYNQFQN